MVQNEWNIYYCIYNMNHFIYIMKTMNVFNTFSCDSLMQTDAQGERTSH